MNKKPVVTLAAVIRSVTALLLTTGEEQARNDCSTFYHTIPYIPYFYHTLDLAPGPMPAQTTEKSHFDYSVTCAESTEKCSASCEPGKACSKARAAL